nr:DUF4194 domain-containing protein [uncultured Brevundimonas sp.]
MLIEFRQLEERDARLFGRVTQLVAHLLRHQFLHIDDRNSPSMMETLRKPAAASLLADYFDVAGYRLVVRESEGWAGIFPDLDRITAPKMRIDETLVLLVLRRLWEEEVQNGDIQTHASVLLTLNAAYDAYQDTVSRARRPALKVGEFRDILLALERRAIVRLGPEDDQAQDRELTIRALISEVAGDDFLTSLEALLQRPDLIEDDADEENAGDPASIETEQPAAMDPA